MLRTEEITSLASSKRASSVSSASHGSGIGATQIEAPSARGASACQISSVTNGMKGCSMRIRASKYSFVASSVAASMGCP